MSGPGYRLNLTLAFILNSRGWGETSCDVRLEAPVIRFAPPGARFACGLCRRAGIFKTPDRGLRGK